MPQTDIDGRRLTLTNLDRVLWPASGFTKGDMVDYYARIGGVLVPHLAGRPVMFGRWPSGVDGRGWGQFECRGRPDWMATRTLHLAGGEPIEFCLVNERAALVWAANQGSIELHPYLALADAWDRPTQMVFDLDPGPPAGMAECARVALQVRERLAADGLDGHPKTSGGSGLHVVVPLNTPHSYSDTKRYARSVAAALAGEQPGLVIDRMSRAERAARVFVDWGQNDQRKQTVAPYSLRATPRPRVATPVSWEEVSRTADGDCNDPLVFGPGEVLARVERHGDLFAPVASQQQRLPDVAG